MRAVKREPGVGYIDTHKWVPLDHPEVPRLKTVYRYYLPGSPFVQDTEDEILYLYKQAQNHLIVPRTASVDCDFVDLRPQVRRTGVVSHIKLDRGVPGVQTAAFNAWMDTECGVLNLACGKGKTVIALHAIAAKKAPTIIILGTKDLINQWRNSICQFLSGFTIGSVQGSPDTWDWKKDIVLASARSLSKYISHMGSEFFTYFGLVIYDEGHHAPAELISTTTDVFWGERRALTATAIRGDGRDPILLNNIGPIFYSDLRPEIPISVCFQTSPFHIKFKGVSEVKDKNGNLNFGKICSYVGQHGPRNEWLIALFQWALERKNKVLALSHSKDQLYTLQGMMEEVMDLDEIAICTGDEDGASRLKRLKNRRFGLGTAQLVREALDMPDLECLILTTPVGKSISGENSLQQAFGRAQRRFEGKTPWVIIILDTRVPMLCKMGVNMMKTLRNWADHKGGPIQYTISPYDEWPSFV